MKVVILAGGLGTRLMEETEARPKPMVEIGGKPILWHIMKMYQAHGFNDFVVCLGYKGYFIKEYFLNYYIYNSDITIELEKNSVEVHYSNTERFKITLVDTGLTTNTAGRIKRIQEHIQEEHFMLTYGDGLSDVNIKELVNYHMQHQKLATLTTIQLPGRFGNLDMDEAGNIKAFNEKPEQDGVWVNGGFFVLNRKVFDYINDDADHIQWERGPLQQIARDGELQAYKHTGFWKCMDALRDKIELEDIWKTGQAPWKKW